MDIRRAEPGDAAALVELAAEVGREEGAWLLTTDAARSNLAEKRYLRAVRRHPDAAVFVVEEQGRLVGRLVSGRKDVEVPMKKAALAVFELHPHLGPGDAELKSYLPPRLLERL